MTYAQITLVGRLGRNPELRVTPQGKEIVTASVAVGTGDKTVWYKINAWEKTGMWLKDAAKGDMVFVQGGLTIGTYEKKTGGTAIDPVVNAQVIRAMKAQRSDSIEDAFGAAQPRQAANSDVVFDDDIPFHHEPRRTVKGDFDAVTRTL